MIVLSEIHFKVALFGGLWIYLDFYVTLSTAPNYNHEKDFHTVVSLKG